MQLIDCDAPVASPPSVSGPHGDRLHCSGVLGTRNPSSAATSPVPTGTGSIAARWTRSDSRCPAWRLRSPRGPAPLQRHDQAGSGRRGGRVSGPHGDRLHCSDNADADQEEFWRDVSGPHGDRLHCSREHMATVNMAPTRLRSPRGPAPLQPEQHGQVRSPHPPQSPVPTGTGSIAARRGRPSRPSLPVQVSGPHGDRLHCSRRPPLTGLGLV